MDTINFGNMGILEISMIGIAIVIVCIVLYFQIISFRDTAAKIKQLANFFPNSDAFKKVDTSITKDIVESKVKLDNFIKNPPAKHVPTPFHVDYTDVEDMEDDDVNIKDAIEFFDVSLIQAKGGSEAFGEVVYETNAYLCKNVGTSADFAILQDICERTIETLESQINNSINVPLYLGLAGTFIGIITGLAGIATNVNELFSDGNMSPLRNLLIGVVIAMVASFIGLGLMIWNSAINYKKGLAGCEKNKNGYYDFLRRELMPTLSSSMASSLNSLKGVLGEFIGKFGHNLDAYANSAELLNDNIEKQHLLLLEINKMKQKEVSVEIAETFNTIKESSESLKVFHDYQNDLNDTIQDVNGAVEKIDGIIKSFDNFTASLNVVVENQGAATELQNQFRTAIEKHFPIGSDMREMYRKQFDELTSDAKEVSNELQKQLQSSTEYIKSFVENNKAAFGALTQLNEVLNTLVEYTKVQATCYKDLKDEITLLKQEQIKTQKDSADLNSDLLKAVREMITAIKSVKN